MKVDLNHYLVDSDNFGGNFGEHCYVPLFRSIHTNLQNTWFLGSIFMNDYVYVFDNTPYTEQMEDYNLVGLGLKNHGAVQAGVEKQYNKKSSTYAPSPDDTTTKASLPWSKEKQAPEPVEEESDDGAVIIQTDSEKPSVIKN